ncbi:MAG TPA: NfeD family protein [Bryobacteraceae bacterium]|jgi:membrane protein implicated in regulation of membrane protease activity
MNWPEIFLFCFAVGALWSFAALLLGGMHLGHSGHGHIHLHAHGHGLHAAADSSAHGSSDSGSGSWIGAMANPSCIAVYLAWFGGVGYLLTRHSGLAFWLDLLIAVIVGLTGAWILAGFLRFLQSRDQPLNPADYEMVGVLGRVSSAIRPEGVGEVIYVRDGARIPVAARSDSGDEIHRGEEVIVTRYEKGIAFVRTWEAMTQGEPATGPQSSQKETKHVE